MFECVKCGCSVDSELDNCGGCTWPCSISGWSRTTFQVRVLTIDTNCINAKQKLVEMNKIESWRAEGKFVIQRADVILDELGESQSRTEKVMNFNSQPNPFTLDNFILDGDDILAGPDIEDILRNILFPTTKNLTRNQKNDVEHLRSHVLVGGDIFLTLNSKDFIVNGKMEKLRKMGVWVFSPKDAVGFLQELYGW